MVWCGVTRSSSGKRLHHSKFERLIYARHPLPTSECRWAYSRTVVLRLSRGGYRWDRSIYCDGRRLSLGAYFVSSST